MELSGRTCEWTSAPIHTLPSFKKGRGCSLTVEHDPLGIPKERRFLRLSGFGAATRIQPFNSNLSNLVRAVAERVFFVKRDGVFKRPFTPKSFARTLNDVRGKLVPYLPSTTPWTYAQFIDSCKGCKKDVYQRAYDSLLTEGPVVQNDSVVEIFTKFEKTDCTTKVDPVPRVISPRSPRFNLAIGRFLKKVEPKIFKSLAKLFGSTTVIKGMNAYESARVLRAKWDAFADPVAVGLDASRFDQHVSVDALKWEHDIYLSCFPIGRHRRKLKNLLDMQLVNHCRGYVQDGKVEYSIEGTRMSGDMNTSLGNCLIMCSMVKAYLDIKGIKGELANNGDDCVVFLDKTDLASFSEGLFDWFKDMGFSMKIEEPVSEFEKVEFCQTHPVFDGNRWLMVRNPKAILTKDTVFLEKFQTQKRVLEWMHAVGMGGLRLTGGLPVLQNFYQAYLRYGRPGVVPKDYMSWYMRKQSVGMDRDFGPVSPEARESFHAAFGITPDEQESLEEIIDTWQYDGKPCYDCDRNFGQPLPYL